MGRDQHGGTGVQSSNRASQKSRRDSGSTALVGSSRNSSRANAPRRRQGQALPPPLAYRPAAAAGPATGAAAAASTRCRAWLRNGPWMAARNSRFSRTDGLRTASAGSCNRCAGAVLRPAREPPGPAPRSAALGSGRAAQHADGGRRPTRSGPGNSRPGHGAGQGRPVHGRQIAKRRVRPACTAMSAPVFRSTCTGSRPEASTCRWLHPLRSRRGSSGARRHRRSVRKYGVNEGSLRIAASQHTVRCALPPAVSAPADDRPCLQAQRCGSGAARIGTLASQQHRQWRDRCLVTCRYGEASITPSRGARAATASAG